MRDPTVGILIEIKQQKPMQRFILIQLIQIQVPTIAFVMNGKYIASVRRNRNRLQNFKVSGDKTNEIFVSKKVILMILHAFIEIGPFDFQKRT